MEDDVFNATDTVLFVVEIEIFLNLRPWKPDKQSLA